MTTNYIDFCVQVVVPTKELKIYPNKMFVIKDVKHIINFKNGDTLELKHVQEEVKGKL